jgi:indole-3-glycerol phosphate synthase
VSAGFLEEMAAASAERVRTARRSVSESRLAEQATHMPRPALLRLDPSGFDLVAELKLRSPAAGALSRPDEDLPHRLTAYAHAGAAAVSVLTEPTHFDGSLAHLSEAARQLAPLGLPVMRKDFLVDPYQLLEARVAGASGALVIVRMLSRTVIDALIERAAALGLFVLLEAFDERDLELLRELTAAHGASATLLAGVNCRDLATLEVVPARLLELAPLLPRDVPCVAESGVGSTTDAARVAAAGYRLALVGSALMRSADPTALARALIAAGRAAVGSP